jgi:hypothetical protein
MLGAGGRDDRCPDARVADGIGLRARVEVGPWPWAGATSVGRVGGADVLDLGDVGAGLRVVGADAVVAGERADVVVGADRPEPSATGAGSPPAWHADSRQPSSAMATMTVAG